VRCPNCGYDVSRPQRYVHRNGGPGRVYVCWKCRYRWETVEVMRGSAERQAFQAAMWRVLSKEGE